MPEGTADAARLVMYSPTSVLSTALLIALSAVAIDGCGTAPPAKQPSDVGANVSTTEATSSAGAAEVTASSQAFCDLVCERARVVPRPADGPDYHAKATANANSVLEAMHEDLLACYKKRIAVNPNAHGFITVDVVIDQDGKVRTVETTGGAVLGERTMACIVHRIERASFDPPHGGGTLRIHVPFSLRRTSTGDDSL